MQKDIFLGGEGDAWLARNQSIVAKEDPVLEGLFRLGFSPRKIVEIGCGGGARLAAIADRYQAEGIGFDPSSQAVERAAKAYPRLQFSVGTADKIKIPNESVDLIIAGFCLYLTDPADHFRIAAEMDRVLRSGGFAVVLDFLSPSAFKNEYSHRAGVYSHKMEFSRMLTWHPAYRLIHRHYLEHGNVNTFALNEAVAADFILKDAEAAFPVGGQHR